MLCNRTEQSMRQQFFIKEHWNDSVDEGLSVERLTELRYMVTMFYSPELKVQYGSKKIELSEYPYKDDDVKKYICQLIGKHGIRAAYGCVYFNEIFESLSAYANEKGDRLLQGVLKAFRLCNSGSLDVLIPSVGLCYYMIEHDFIVSA